MKKSNYLQTDDTEKVNYNSRIEPDDLSTVNYNSGAETDDVSDAEMINYDTTNKSSVAHQQAKRIIEKYKIKYLKRYLKRNVPLKNIYVTKMRKKDNSDDDVVFIKQVPAPNTFRLARAAKKDNVIFVKQMPLHARDRLKKKTKILKHPRDRLKDKELQVARNNVSALVEGKFSFLPEKFLNKTVLFNVSKVNEEKIIDKVIETLPADNDELYIVHEPGTNAFSLRGEDGKLSKNIARDKKIYLKI